MDDRSKSVAMYAAASALAGFAAWQFLAGSKRPSLRGQVVVITGGSRGLGLQLARDFAAHRCKLAICARTGEDLEVAADDLKARGAEVLAKECDVRSRSEVEEFIRAVLARFGRIDVLVNNAGIMQVGPIESMELEDFEEAMDVMFWGVLYPIWAALPHMLDRGRGRIVNITSIGGKVSVPHMVPYSCAKFATVALSEGLRTELGPKGIQVLTVVPGLMRTGSFLNALFKGKQEDEFAWFGLSAAAPGISMDVERASSQIIGAMRAGRTEHILTAPAQLFARLHGAFPELTTALMTAINQYILPSAAGGSREAVSGAEADRRLDSPVFRFLTMLGRMAADRMNERVQHA
jgi:NAD(P)-dependent dehydrogenase (short-subunit alcohol dehydrogenase family)